MDDKQTCKCCNKPKKLDDYYSSSSFFMKNNGRVHVCKQCIWEYVEPVKKNFYDMAKVEQALRMIDKPFLRDLWESSVTESDKKNGEYFKTYMKNLALPHNRELSWNDSEFKERKIETIEDLEVSDVEYSKDDIDSLTSFFGKGLSIEDYIWLNEEYQDFLNRYECDSKGMEMLIKQICLTELDIEKRRANNEKVDAQLKTLQDLLGSSNLKPVQETGANSVEQETFGTLIKKYENERPIPEPDEKWKDVDGITKYIKVFFTGHLARMLGKKDEDLEKDYWEEMEKFTVKEPEKEDGDDDDIV